MTYSFPVVVYRSAEGADLIKELVALPAPAAGR